MKIGFNSAILDSCTFEEVIDFASENNFSCVELCAWPRGNVARKYAGVTHLDVDTYDKTYVEEYCQKKNVEISALAYYPNVLTPNKEESAKMIAHIYKLIDVAKDLNIGLVNTFIGRNQNENVQENIKEAIKTWQPILEYAKEQQVKIAIENCPMLFTNDEWPGGQNIMTTPAVFRTLFKALPYENFGLNFDPSHFVWQQMDYTKPIYEFSDRLFHIHFKDIKIYRDKLNDVGIMAVPLDYIQPKLPGLGDVDWAAYVSALTDVGYDGYAVIEVEDKAFEANLEKRKESILISRNYLAQYFAL